MCVALKRPALHKLCLHKHRRNQDSTAKPTNKPGRSRQRVQHVSRWTEPHRHAHLGSWWQTEPENLLTSTDSLCHLMKSASVFCVCFHDIRRHFSTSNSSVLRSRTDAKLISQAGRLRKALTEQSDWGVCTQPESSF